MPFGENIPLSPPPITLAEITANIDHQIKHHEELRGVAQAKADRCGAIVALLKKLKRKDL